MKNPEILTYLKFYFDTLKDCRIQAQDRAKYFKCLYNEYLFKIKNIDRYDHWDIFYTKESLDIFVDWYKDWSTD